MITPAHGARVWLAAGFTDMRKGFDGLAMLVQEKLKRDPFGGEFSIPVRASGWGRARPLVTVEYRIDPRDREPFLAAIEKLGQERRRGGAYAREFPDIFPVPN